MPFDLTSLAAELGVRIVGPMRGGEFGATLVADERGRELVLKTLSHPGFAPYIARGARLAERLRRGGYPAPEYAGTGVASGVTWSLQERLPGETPDVMSPAHAQQLVDLVGRHAGAAGETDDWRTSALQRMHEWATAVAAHDAARTLARELAAVADRSANVDLLDDGIVHSDFHHRNFLAIGDEVTGIFDWDFAVPGDWRLDLVTLAFWAAFFVPAQVPPDAARIIIDRAHDACPPDVLALLSAYQALRQLDYDARAHPDRLDGLLAGLEAAIAPWWRAVL